MRDKKGLNAQCQAYPSLFSAASPNPTQTNPNDLPSSLQLHARAYKLLARVSGVLLGDYDEAAALFMEYAGAGAGAGGMGMGMGEGAAGAMPDAYAASTYGQGQGQGGATMDLPGLTR